MQKGGTGDHPLQADALVLKGYAGRIVGKTPQAITKQEIKSQPKRKELFKRADEHYQDSAKARVLINKAAGKEGPAFRTCLI